MGDDKVKKAQLEHLKQITAAKIAASKETISKLEHGISLMEDSLAGIEKQLKELEAN